MSGWPFGDRVPRWPPLAGVAALLGAGLVAAIAPLVAAGPALVTGAERTAPVVALLAAVVTAAGIVAVVVFLARLTRPVSAAQLGLRAPERGPRALLLFAAAAAVAAAWAALGEPAVPPELDTRSLTAQAYGLPLREPVELGPGLAASALARCVLPVVAGEILLRGFVFPALAGWRGPLPAALIVSVLFGGFAQVVGTPGIAVLSMLLGLLLCGLYVATGSLLPGLALAAAAAGAGLGVAGALAASEVAVLAVACAAVAVVPALPRVAALQPRTA